MVMDVVLASRSPRRTDLLDLLGVPHRAVPSGISEEPMPGEGAEAQVVRLARRKAEHVASLEPRADLVIGADTLVVLDGSAMGQPGDAAEAAGMLRRLSGRTHTVLTGMCLLRDGDRAEGVSSTGVTFHRLSEAEIAWYVGSGEPMDKAGAYAAQGIGAVFLRRIEGSFHNVVGFPLDLFYQLLPQMRISLRDLL